MKELQDARQVILQVVRGERPWGDLGDLGINLQIDHTEHGQLQAQIENPNELSAIATASDLAQGLLSHRANTDQLRTWAFILEAGSFVEFDLADCSGGELLLEALWDASYGQDLDPAAIELAEELVASHSHR